MGSFRLRQGPQQRRLAGISLRFTFLGLVLGVSLLAAAPSAASAAVDLSIAKTAPATVLVGDEIAYDLTIQNKDPAAEATAVQVVDSLPAGVLFESATPSQGTCSESAGTVTCDLGALASTISTTVQIKVQATTHGAITNTATVSIPTDPTPDPTPEDNSASAQTTVSPVADLVLTMTAVPDPVVSAELLTYTLTVQNSGPSEATNVSVTDTLPAAVHFVTATSGCSESAGIVTCDLEPLASGGSSTVDITVRPQNAGSITNQATVGSAAHDPDPANNSKIVDVTVSPAPSPTGGGQAGDGSPKTGPLNVVLTGSYVLISGRSVKLVKGKFVPVKLTCAGQRKCAGTITVTTTRTVKSGRKGKKRKRRVARLGSKSFSIEGNRQEKVLVPLSKKKVKLLKRLKRVKAKAAIREIDLKGNPRISTRSFMLRAR
jgi:uncharacterized repeat protein (TIGR01451 family)